MKLKVDEEEYRPRDIEKVGRDFQRKITKQFQKITGKDSY